MIKFKKKNAQKKCVIWNLNLKNIKTVETQLKLKKIKYIIHKKKIDLESLKEDQK